MSDESDGSAVNIWPDDLELDDTLEYDGDKYVVVGTGPGEATLDPVEGDDSTEMKVFRWAFTNAVGIEIETSLEQDEFEKLVNTEAE